jgi:hypothetical protein
MRSSDDEIHELLRHVDHSVPLVSVDSIVRRARAHPSRGPRALVTGIATLVLAGAALAMPWSQLPRFFNRGPSPALTQPSVAPGRVTKAVATGRPESSSVTVVAIGSFDLSLEAPQATGALRVELVPDNDLSVRARGGAVDYVVLPGGLRLRNGRASASYDVRVPRALRALRIHSGSIDFFTKTGDFIATVGDRQTDGTFLIPLTKPAR